MSSQIRHRGKQVSQEHRASIVSMHHGRHGQPFSVIAQELGIKENTCAKIYRHATQGLSKVEQRQLSTVLNPDQLKPKPRPGRPRVLTEDDKNHLIQTAKHDRKTRRMPLKELQLAANLSHVSKQTCLNALHERGLKAYKENLKPVLEEYHRQCRKRFAFPKLNWVADKEWANWGFTDEIGVTIGGSWGVKTVWREKVDEEKWADDCLGGKRPQGETIMFWGMIGYGYKGPCHVWETETDAEKTDAENAIAEINAIVEEECNRWEKQWKASDEFQELRKRELETARQLRKEAKV